MNLSRSDLLELCGPADGIRLYNALHPRPAPRASPPPPLRTLFVRRRRRAGRSLGVTPVGAGESRGDGRDMMFEAVYLHELSVEHLREKLAAAFALDAGALLTICVLVRAAGSGSAAEAVSFANIEDGDEDIDEEEETIGSGNDEPTSGRCRPLNPSVKNTHFKTPIEKHKFEDVDYKKVRMVMVPHGRAIHLWHTVLCYSLCSHSTRNKYGIRGTNGEHV